MPDEEMPFSLDWLAGAAARPPVVLSACDRGHLVVNQRTHYLPVRLSEDLRVLWMRWVDHPEGSQS
ncbi:hypothetical protein ACWKSP_26445 [Micromonosporaceae bacterium Da 78-11]